MRLPDAKGGSIGSVDGFPPAEVGDAPLYDVQGFELGLYTGDATNDAVALVGMQVRAAGDYSAKGFRVRYHVGSDHFELVAPQIQHLCAPRQSTCDALPISH